MTSIAPESASDRKSTLVTDSFRQFRMHFTLYLRIVSMVAVPNTLISVFLLKDAASTGGDPGISVYLSFATLLMNLALLWAISRAEAGTDVTVGQAYYTGTASILRFILSALAVTAATIPAVFALLFYQYGALNATVTVSGGEKLLLGVVALVIATPSVLLVPRLVFALPLVVDSELTPLTALARSWQLTKKRLRTVLGQLAKLAAVYVIIVVPFALTLAFTENSLVTAVLDFLVITLLLPFTNIYFYKLYRSLQP